MITRRDSTLLLSLAAAALVVAALAPVEHGSAQLQPMHCTVTTSTSVSFGSYNVFNTSPVDGTGFVTLECVQVGPADQVMIAIGHGAERSFMPRAMTNGRSRLEYNLYLDAARTTIWGDGTRGTSAFQARPPDGRQLSVPIFGRIPSGQNATPGSYSDQLIVTVQY